MCAGEERLDRVSRTEESIRVIARASRFTNVEIRGLEFADGALENGDLRHRVTGRREFVSDHVLEVG